MNIKYDISIIVPFYKGNQYIDGLLKMIESNVQDNLKIELVIVNDSPEILVKNITSDVVNITIITNKSNVGIHKSRVNGINNCCGDYILMLDQDDIISANTLKTLFNQIKTHDIVVSNGFDENPVSYGKIYKTKNSQNLIKKEKYYFYIGNMIVSPGQCLIKKESIPKLWLTANLRYNGCDDLLLWLLMFESKKSFTVCYDSLYRHTFNGKNVSSDFKSMKKSLLEIIDLLERQHLIKKNNKKILIERLKMREISEGKNIIFKIVALFLHPKLMLVLLYKYLI